MQIVTSWIEQGIERGHQEAITKEKFNKPYMTGKELWYISSLS
ncbi:MAG: hypothetical protein ACKPFD_08180 [Dolichospermum sp.]